MVYYLGVKGQLGLSDPNLVAGSNTVRCVSRNLLLKVILRLYSGVLHSPIKGVMLCGYSEVSVNGDYFRHL
jgi:hypothetical protein